MIFSTVWYNYVHVLVSCDFLCDTFMCLCQVVVIVSAVWYNYMFVLGSCDFLRCVV